MPETALIDHGRLLEEIGQQAELLVAAAGSVSPDTPVRVCPGWTVGEVVRHVGSAYRAALTWLIEGRRPQQWQREPAPGQTVEDYLREGLAELTAVFARHDPSDPAAGWWTADPTYGFWYRRMAHETTIHRLDVEEAAGLERSDVTVEMALDGVDEALLLWFDHRLPRLGLSGTRDGSVVLRSRDRVWITHAGPGRTTAQRCDTAEMPRSDAVVSGSALSMYLWLWGRERPGVVTVEGDDDAAGQLWALLRLATR